MANLVAPRCTFLKLTPFKTLEREVAAEITEGWETIRGEGWKDSVLIVPSERVKLLMKFELSSEA